MNYPGIIIYKNIFRKKVVLSSRIIHAFYDYYIADPEEI